MSRFYQSNKVPFGGLQGVADGVPAYSNGNDEHFSGVRHICEVHNISTGFQFQCVEYARRWLLHRKGLYLPDVRCAAYVIAMTRAEDVSRGEAVPMVAVRNGSTVKPSKDALLIWPENSAAPFGHIGVIVEVTETHVRIADQNQHFHKWQSNYSTELPYVFDAATGTYTILDRARGRPWNPSGWMVFPHTPNRDQSQPIEWHRSYKRHRA